GRIVHLQPTPPPTLSPYTTLFRSGPRPCSPRGGEGKADPLLFGDEGGHPGQCRVPVDGQLVGRIRVDVVEEAELGRTTAQVGLRGRVPGGLVGVGPTGQGAVGRVGQGRVEL